MGQENGLNLHRQNVEELSEEIFLFFNTYLLDLPDRGAAVEHFTSIGELQNEDYTRLGQIVNRLMSATGESLIERLLFDEDLNLLSRQAEQISFLLARAISSSYESILFPRRISDAFSMSIPAILSANTAAGIQLLQDPS